MPAYRFETYGELQPWLGREWLLTNGTGSFASSTLVGCNTRRYHGLLVAATMPPVGRVLALSRIAESVALDDHVSPVELSINQFNQFTVPRGDRYLRHFELEHTAKFTFDADGATVTKEVLLVWGKPIVGIRYRIDPGPHKKAELRLMPFVVLRDFHGTLHKGDVHFDLKARADGVEVGRQELTLNLHAGGATFAQCADWWYDHTYPLETERGLDDREDLFTPGVFTISAQRGAPATVTFWAGICHTSNVPGEGLSCHDLNTLDFDAELARVASKDWANDAPTHNQQRLYRASSQFAVKRNRPDGSQGTTILAGYPWFSDWGRDSMISLPGLLLATLRRFKEAGQVLGVFAVHVSEGMIPNYFNDYSNEPSYNTVDASLWFIHSAFEYLRITRDQDLFQSLLMPACEEIVDGYQRGTRYNIKMDPADGLISAGDATTQLTWMDAKLGDEVFTPRHGKAIEINALWYNALCLIGDGQLAAKVKANFANAFWISPYRGLADVIHDGEVSGARDEATRPNQIFAVSLPHSPLTLDQQRSVVEVVRELLTPLGLRMLDTGNPKYIGKLSGPPYERDRAYHNGTIWPWLIGPFLDAYLRVNNKSPESKDQARDWLKPLLGHLKGDACIGSISECADGDPPHRPVACYVRQAWSVAEVLRLAQELEM